MKLKISNKKVKKEMAARAFLVLFIFVFCLKFVSGIGITPARTTLNFEPNLETEIPFSIINSENKDMAVAFFVKGELNDSITLYKAYDEFSSTEDQKSYSYSVRLPDKITPPGRHEVEIIAMELPKDFKEKGTFIGSTLSVVTQLHVYVPYPGKYLEAEFEILQKDGKILFFIPVTSRGKLGIGNAKAIIDVYTLSNEKVVTLETNSRSVKSEERTELVSEWLPDVNPGPYRAVVTLTYDDETITLQKNFDVGQMLVEIEDIQVRDFRLGEIAKFNILVNNRWSQELRDVFVKMEIFNNENEIMAEIRSVPYNIPALSKIEMVAYWDTVGVSANTYDGKLYLNYNNRSVQRPIQLKVTGNNIEVIGITGRVVGGNGGFDLQKTLMVLIIILLLNIGLIWFVILRKRKKAA